MEENAGEVENPSSPEPNCDVVSPSKKQKRKSKRFIFILLFIPLIGLSSYFLVPNVKAIFTEHSRLKIKAVVNDCISGYEQLKKGKVPNTFTASRLWSRGLEANRNIMPLQTAKYEVSTEDDPNDQELYIWNPYDPAQKGVGGSFSRYGGTEDFVSPPGHSYSGGGRASSRSARSSPARKSYGRS